MANKWSVTTTFGDLIDQGALEIGDGYRAKNDELGGDGKIFLRAGHVKDQYIDFSGAERFHEELESKLVAKLSRPGDTIVTTKGNSTGRTSFVQNWMPEFVYSPHLSYWRSANREIIDNGYLRYWSKCREFVEQLNGMKISTDMAPYLSLTDQKRLGISLPAINDQRAITHILGTLDDKIELNRKTNETLEAMAKALFKSWFVDFDPVKAKAEGRPTGLPDEISDLFPDSFEDSELGEIPRGWGVKVLDDVAHFLNGLALQKFPSQEGEPTLPVIKIAQLKKGDTLGADRCSTAVPDEYVIRDGDVLFSWSGSLAVDIWCGGEGALNQHLFKVTSKTYQKWFVYQWVKHHLPEFQEIAQGKATTMGHIQRHHLSEAKALVPTASLLSAMDSAFTPLLDRAFGLRRQSRELSFIRDALLPKLISGEIRIPDAERLISNLSR